MDKGELRPARYARALALSARLLEPVLRWQAPHAACRGIRTRRRDVHRLRPVRRDQRATAVSTLSSSFAGGQSACAASLRQDTQEAGRGYGWGGCGRAPVEGRPCPRSGSAGGVPLGARTGPRAARHGNITHVRDDSRGDHSQQGSGRMRLWRRARAFQRSVSTAAACRSLAVCSSVCCATRADCSCDKHSTSAATCQTC